MKFEKKGNSGQIIECKELDINGIPVGIVEGYIATWDVDTWSDQFVKGAFSEDLERLRRKGKDIPLKAEHKNVIGKFPIDTVVEDDRGLFGIGQVNLNVQEGREFFSLAKQKAISDFSIGFSAQDKQMENGIRKIFKSKVFEGSMVGNPMNENANITEVKSRDEMPSLFAGFDDYFDESFIDDERAFLMEEKFQVADYMDGELKIFPRAVVNARIELSQVGLADTEEIKNARGVINQLYSEMNMNEPFSHGFPNKLSKREVKCAKKGALVDILKKSFSKDASDYIASLIVSDERSKKKTVDNGGDYMGELLEMLNKTKENLEL